MLCFWKRIEFFSTFGQSADDNNPNEIEQCKNKITKKHSLLAKSVYI
jgi:hypothetical protein